MTLKEIFGTCLIHDETKIVIRNDDFQVLTSGHWYQDNILEYLSCTVVSFTWESDNTAYFDLWV